MNRLPNPIGDLIRAWSGPVGGFLQGLCHFDQFNVGVAGVGEVGTRGRYRDGKGEEAPHHVVLYLPRGRGSGERQDPRGFPAYDIGFCAPNVLDTGVLEKG